MERFTFTRDERLCSQKLIGDLFAGGESFLAYPLKVIFLNADLGVPYPVQAAFTVSKRNFKRAVKRNIMKRRMREAYRLNKTCLYDELASKNLQLAVMFVYVGKDISEYPAIEKGMISAFRKLLGKV